MEPGLFSKPAYHGRVLMNIQFNRKSCLTPNQVAKLLFISVDSVRNWANSGELHAHVTPGGHRRFFLEDVEAFAAKRGLYDVTGKGQLRILVVDDDRDFVEYLADLLVHRVPNCLVESAVSGFAAGQKVPLFCPNILLLDLRMPGIDGFDICRQLKSNKSTERIRILAMTGYPSLENNRKIVEAGAESCLSKPIDTKEMLSLIYAGVESPTGRASENTYS